MKVNLYGLKDPATNKIVEILKFATDPLPDFSDNKVYYILGFGGNIGYFATDDLLHAKRIIKDKSFWPEDFDKMIRKRLQVFTFYKDIEQTEIPRLLGEWRPNPKN